MTSRMFDFFNATRSAPTNVESSENAHRTFQPVKPGVNKSKNTGLKARQPFAERGPLTPIKTNLQTNNIISKHSRSVLQDTPILKKTQKRDVIPFEDFGDIFNDSVHNCHEQKNSPYDEFEHIFPKKNRLDKNAIVGILKSVIPSQNSQPKFKEPEPIVISKIDIPECLLSIGDHPYTSEKLDWEYISDDLPDIPVPTFDDDDFIFEAAMH